MSAFDKIIGYKGIKDELLQICDMYANPELYAKLGAAFPQGVLLYGDPGLGKTMMCKAFIEECGIYAVTVRRNVGGDAFVDKINDAFREAREHAPAIVFLDDMDKFANADEEHQNAPEYVAVQAGIDDCKGSEVFVLATINDIDNLPESLLRAGRFDRTIEFQRPRGQDAQDIIGHYLSDKNIADDVNLDDLSKMISYRSCAELESLINEAAIRAAYKRNESIKMEDLVQAVLSGQYKVRDLCSSRDEEEVRKIAIHEAGHLVVSEALLPESVGFISVESSGRDSVGGFVHVCERQKRRPNEVMLCLAGKAATEMYYAFPVASGCSEDIERALSIVSDGISENATHGLSSVYPSPYRASSEGQRVVEIIATTELERLYQQTRQILIDNKEFLEKIVDALCEKRILLHSEIQEIKNSCGSVGKAA